MNKSGCSHIRFRSNGVHDMNMEDFIKHIERTFAIDFRSLPEWKDLVHGLHKTFKDCTKKTQDAKFRKLLIIHKIYVEWFRPSPFILTDNLARTSKKWTMLKEYHKKRDTSVHLDSVSISNVAIYGEELNEESETAHPNTEIISSEGIVLEEKLNNDAETNLQISDSQPQICLPISLRTNLHKNVSPLNSKDSSLSKVTVNSYDKKAKQEIKELEWLQLNQTLAVQYFPKELLIETTSFDEQCIKFSLINIISEILYVRLKYVTDKSSLKRVKIFPVTPVRLYPGVPMSFKFIFILSQKTKDFMSSIYFKVGRKVMSEILVEALCIPIVSKFNSSCLVSVSELVTIPPIYAWQMKYGYPKAAVTVFIGDTNNYDLHIIKRIVDYTKDYDESKLSLETIAPNTESIEDRMEDSEIECESKILTSSNAELRNEEETIDSIVITSLVFEEIVNRSLDSFWFEKSYFHIQSQTKQYVCVMFAKAERVGKHQCYYDFEFHDPETEKFLFKRTTKIFAEILPHPIQIYPKILDMSHSAVTHGFCKGIFNITNSHKIYPAMIKVKLTKKMHKIFNIKPMIVVIPTTSSVNFEVTFCSTELLLPIKKLDNLVHFTLKIIVNGHKSIYGNLPPFFYEIIAPCALEFKKIYNKKYYKEVIEKISADADEC